MTSQQGINTLWADCGVGSMGLSKHGGKGGKKGWTVKVMVTKAEVGRAG